MMDDIPRLEDWLAEQVPENLQCRRWGHAWMPWRYIPDPEPGVVSRTVLRCMRCKNKARDDMDSYGFSDRDIDYIDGYCAPAGMGRLSREDRAVLRLITDQHLRADSKVKRG